jgi:heterotetrameric sarcosine oxidase gamma subunit
MPDDPAAGADGVDLLRSAVETVEPQADGGWLVSARSTDADLRLVDCSPVIKVLVQAPPAGLLADHLEVPFGRAELFEDGFLTVSAAPGEWLLLCPTDPRELLGRLGEIAPAQPMGVVDVTHGRTLLRLSGHDAAAVLAPLTALDLSERTFPSGAATAAAVAGVRATIVRDDLFADEAGLSPPTSQAASEGAGADAAPGADQAGDERPDIPSYLLCCDRSTGRYVYEQLLEVGGRLGLAEEGYVHYRARRPDA